MRGGRRSHRSGSSGRHGAGTDRAHRGAEAERHAGRSSRPRPKPELPWTSLEDVWGETSNEGSPSPTDVERSAVPVAAPADIWGSGDIVVDRSAWGPRRPEDLPPRPEGAHAAGSSAGPGRPGGGGSRGDLSRLARGGSINFGGALANGLFGFLLVLVITRGLIPAAAGVFFEAIAMFQILGNITQLGADDGLVRTVSRLQALGRTGDLRRTIALALWPVLIVSSIAAVLTLGFAPQLSRLFVHGRGSVHRDALVPYLRLMAPFLPLAAASGVILAGTRGFGTMVPTVAVENFGKPSLRPVAALVVLAAGLGVAALALTWSILVAVGAAVGLLWLLKLLRRAERRGGQESQPAASRSELASQFWRFAAPRGLAAVFGVTVFWLDTLLLGALRTTREAGIYTAATRYVFLGFFALSATQQVVAPLISGLIARGDTDRAQRVYRTATQWLVALSWPVFLVLAVFAPFLLRVFRAEYAAGGTALMILSLAMLVSSAAGPCMVTLLMAGKSTWALFNSGVGLTLNVLLNLALIPRLGMTGAALAWSASIIAVNGLAIFQVARFLKLTPFDSGFAAVAAAATGLFGGLGLLARWGLGMSIGGFVLFGAVSAGTYAMVLRRWRHRLHLDVLREAVRLRGERLEARAGRAEARV